MKFFPIIMKLTYEKTQTNLQIRLPISFCVSKIVACFSWRVMKKIWNCPLKLLGCKSHVSNAIFLEVANKGYISICSLNTDDILQTFPSLPVLFSILRGTQEFCVNSSLVKWTHNPLFTASLLILQKCGFARKLDFQSCMLEIIFGHPLNKFSSTSELKKKIQITLRVTKLGWLFLKL